MVAAPDGLVLLVRGELGLSAEALPVRLRAGAALAGGDADKLALELGDPGARSLRVARAGEPGLPLAPPSARG